ncbi:MAG: pilus assembly protein [Acidimicrobiia bacterium]|nr:pilus assembly protein [Acidimicrobiia bacterium]
MRRYRRVEEHLEPSAPTGARSARRHGRWRDRGAAVVEAAFVAPIFFVLIFGIMEFGFAFQERLTTVNMSQTGARTGASAADDPLADYRILRKIRTESASVPAARITHIVVYKATGPGSVVPEACKMNPQTGICNLYTGNTLANVAADFGCTSDDVGYHWCPTDRKATTSGDGPDYVGVYVRIEHPTITGFFGEEFVFTSDTVMRIEPRSSL